MARIGSFQNHTYDRPALGEEPEVTPPEPEVAPEPLPDGNPELPSEIPPVSQPEASLA
ncbi:MAG: hypothetical protein WBQ60_04165 [Asticcacaulis sp.]